MEAVTLMLESDIWDVEPKSLENNLAEITKMSATLQGSQQTHNHQSYNHGAATQDNSNTRDWRRYESLNWKIQPTCW